MQYVESYYDIQARIRYYGRLPESVSVEDGHVFGKLGKDLANVIRWKEPPHEVLANMRRTGEYELCDPKAVELFVRKYGVLWGRLNEMTYEFDESCTGFSGAQATLCRAWRQDKEAMEDVEAQVQHALDARTSIKLGGVELTTENLWSFICVLFLRDHLAGKARICESPDCANPYFLAKRRGQKFCSHVCAVRENVRRFRRAELQAQPKKIARKRGRR
jgi:hypothetical protein